MRKIIEYFKIFSDENRLRIIMMLKVKPMCVCEMYEILDIANSTLSSHLKILKNAKIIEQNKDGRWIEYSITNDKYIKNVLHVVEDLIEDRSRIISDRKKAQTINRESCTNK